MRSTRRGERRRIWTGTALAALAGTAGAQERDPGLLRAGEPLPHLELPTIDGGEVVDLAEIGRGKKVLLVQFASW